MEDPVRRLLRARRRLPLWARWAAAIVSYVLLALVIVLVVHALAHSSSSADRKAEANAVAEANNVGRVAVAEDQAPHSARAAGAPVASALDAAIADDVHRRIAHGQLTGPLQKVNCSADGRAHSGTRAFRCTVTSAGIDYEFQAVDRAGGQLTWCKLDRAPGGDSALEVPLSPRCQP